MSISIGLSKSRVNNNFQLWYLLQSRSYATAPTKKEGEILGKQDIEDALKSGKSFPAMAIIAWQ
jgi:hypothetical protein